MQLNETQIRHHINTTALNNRIHFHLFDTIDSTNLFLKNCAISHDIHICCAETQTKGKGRFGRTWYSPAFENIYFSARFRLPCDISQLTGLSLVTSLAVLETLKELTINYPFQIKWPNDVLCHHKKISGCLVELVSSTGGRQTDVIVGIGLNVNSKAEDTPLIDKPWSSLFDITSSLYDRNKIIACLVKTLNNHIDQLISLGFSSFLPRWQTVDYLKGQTILVTSPSGRTTYNAKGVNALGQLIAETETGEIIYLSTGDTSVYPVPSQDK